MARRIIDEDYNSLKEIFIQQAINQGNVRFLEITKVVINQVTSSLRFGELLRKGIFH